MIKGPIDNSKLSVCARTLKPPGNHTIGDGGNGGVLISSVFRESVSIHPGLQLVRGLWAPLEVALLETPVDADGKVVRDLKEKYGVISREARLQLRREWDLHQWQYRRLP